MSLKIVLGACLLAEATANFISPGLDKCLDLEAELKDDGTRETLEDMLQDNKTGVQLYECHGNHNQHFEIVNGQFRSFSMKNFCLTASAIEDNADVHLEKCEEENERQQWDLTGDGNVKVVGSEECLDVKAALKDDGTREKWHELKEHKVVNVHLYKCHDPKKTERVNQLWAWMPYKNGKLLIPEIPQRESEQKEEEPQTEAEEESAATEMEHEEPQTEQKWAVAGLKLPGSSSATMVPLTGLVAAGLFALGVLAGKRMRGSSGEPMLSVVAEE